MSSWKALQPGDSVEIVAPGMKCSRAEFHGAVRYLKALGLKPEYPEDLFGPHTFCANSDDKRFQFFKSALYSKKTKALWCLRAGYGAGRFIERLAKIRPTAKPKLFIGYSDATVLHNLMNNSWGWPTIHGPLLDRLGSGRASRTELREMKSLVFGDLQEIEFANLKPLNIAAKRNKNITGGVVGGNLAVIQTTLGTKLQTYPKGKIIFLEDIGERGYSVDRMLWHLTQADYFKQARAIIFGDFVGGAEQGGQLLWKKAIKEFAERQKVPVLSGMKAGHGKVQRPVPFNTRANLACGLKPSLKVKANGN